MNITLSLPANVVQELTENGEDISRTVREPLALGGSGKSRFRWILELASWRVV
jgi:hypothetical protein